MLHLGNVPPKPIPAGNPTIKNSNALSGYVMGWWWTMINRSTLSTNYINHHRRSTMKYKPWKLKLETLQKWDDVLGRYTILTGKTTYLRSKIPTWKMILHFSKNKLPRSFGKMILHFSQRIDLFCFLQLSCWFSGSTGEITWRSWTKTGVFYFPLNTGC